MPLMARCSLLLLIDSQYEIRRMHPLKRKAFYLSATCVGNLGSDECAGDDPACGGPMKTRGLTVAALALLIASTTGVMAAQYYGPPPPARYAQEPGWDQVPPEFRAAQQRGFRDGGEGARKDFQNHRPPNVNNRDEYRNPHFIASPDRADYRMGFRQGYDVAVRHIYGSRY